MLRSVTRKLKPVIEAKLNEEYALIANEANLFCLDYIEGKLKRCQISDSRLEFIRPSSLPETSVAVSAKIIEIGELLEAAYPWLYCNVSKQLRVKLRSDVVIGDVFRNFGRELYRDGVTWIRVVALFAFAAALSIDCVRQGRLELVQAILNCVRSYVQEYLAVWIKNQGGWIDFTKKFKCVKRSYSMRDLLSWIPKMFFHIISVAQQGTNAFWELVHVISGDQ